MKIKEKVLKCTCCNNSFDKKLMSIECPDCYLKGMEKEGFISREEVGKVIDELLKGKDIKYVNEKELKQKLGIEDKKPGNWGRRY